MRIRICISLFFLVFAFLKANAQTYNYSYTDPCTGNVKTLIVPINGSVTVGYYGFVENFTQQDFTNGNFEAWTNNVFSQYTGSPCSEIIGLSGQINMAQDVALNTIGIINSLSSLMDLANGSTDFLSGTLTSATNSSNTQEKKDKNNKGGNSESSSPSNNAGNSNNNTNNNGGSNTNQVGGSNSTAANNQNVTNGTGNPNGGGQTNTGSNEGGSNSGGTGTPGSNAGNEGQTSTGSTATQGGSNENGNSQASTSVTNQNSNINENNINSTVNSNPNSPSGNGNSESGNNGQETQGQTNQGTVSGTTDPSGSSGNNTSGASSSGSTGENGNSPGSEETAKPQEEKGGQTNITQGATKTVNQNREGGSPTVIASSDFVGFNFQNSEVKTGLKLTGGYHNMRWDGGTARGGLLDYVSAQKGPNLTAYHAWIKKKSVGLLSGTLSVGFEGRGSIYGTLAGGQMLMFPKIPHLKAVYMGTISYGQVYKTPFLGSALIAGGMYDLKFGRRIDMKIMALFVYSPYVSYYNDLVLKSPYVILPSLGTNINITKRFKFNINAGGAWAINVNTLNYTITCGTRLLVGQ